MPEGRATSSPRGVLDGHGPIVGRVLPARAARFALGRLLSMDKARVMVFGSVGVPDPASRAAGSDMREDELALYSDDDDADVSDFAV